VHLRRGSTVCVCVCRRVLCTFSLCVCVRSMVVGCTIPDAGRVGAAAREERAWLRVGSVVGGGGGCQ
jgi:hypothetical protein